MARDIRIFRRGAIHYVTNRTYHDEFRLTPGPLVNLLVRSSLIRAANRTGVIIIVALAMGNHFEMVVEDPWDVLDTFMEEFQKELSHRLNRLRGIEHSNFPERYDAHELGDREACEKKIAEILCNPVRSGLVYRVDDWPGFSTIDAHRSGDSVMESAKISRAKAADLREQGIDESWLAAMERIRVKLRRPKFCEHMTDAQWHARVCELVEAEEKRLQEAMEKRNARTVGPARLLAQSWWERPDQCEWRRYRRCISTDPDVADAYDQFYKETEATYKRAARRWRHCGRWGEYPPGTFPPGWLRCLPSSSEVGPRLPWMTERQRAS